MITAGLICLTLVTFAIAVWLTLIGLTLSIETLSEVTPLRRIVGITLILVTWGLWWYLIGQNIEISIGAK